jgi:LacI family transcriptional regulator
MKQNAIQPITSEITLREVAKRAGVSLATASRYLNGKADMESPSSKKLREIIQETGYRCKRYNKSTTTVLIYHQQFRGKEDHRFQITNYAEQELNANNVDILKTNTQPLHKVISDYNIDGILLVDNSILSKELNDFPIPVVSANFSLSEAENCISVESNDPAGIIDVFKFFKEAGHQRIATFWVCNIERPYYKHRRKCLPCDIYDQCKLPYDKDLVWGKDFSSGMHEKEIEQAVDYWLSLPEPPTAIFSTGDVYVPYIYECLRNHGLKLPEDMSVAGFDDEAFCQIIHPKLTSVRKPLVEIGRIAAQTLIKQINEPNNIITRTLIRPKLIVRDSVAKIN